MDNNTSYKESFFRNLFPFHLTQVQDVPDYFGNGGKYLRIKEDESGLEWYDLKLNFNKEQFIIKNDISIKDYISKTFALNTFAKKQHNHLKKDIKDFKENDYVHTKNNEKISGIKTFIDKVIFEKDIIIKGEVLEVDTTNVIIEDNIITLNKNNKNTLINAGIEIDRGDNESAKLLWNENNKQWEIGISNTVKILDENDKNEINNEIKIIDEKIEELSNKIEINKNDIQYNIKNINNIYSEISSLKNSLKNLNDKVKNILSIKDITEKFILKTNENTIILQNDIYKEKNYFVFKNGILQEENDDYIIENNKKIIFKEKSIFEDKIIIKYSYISK